MLQREGSKSEVLAQSIELLIARLKPRGISREGLRHGVNPVGDKAERFRRNQFARPQQPSRIA